MKHSQIALLSVIGVLAGAIVASVVSARIALSPDSTRFVDGARISESAELRGVREIEVAGAWRVNASRGDDWKVDLSYSEGYEDRVTARIVGARLRLGTRSESRLDEPKFRPTADIVMPVLEEVEVRGSARLDLSGFKGERLDIDIAGAAQLTGRDGRFHELELSVAGASHIDLQGVSVTDADIDLAGASKVTLTMAGGALSGTIAGAGSVEYYGWISANRVQTAGFARVEHVR